MATTIKLKNGSGAPLAGDLVQGEPALDLTNKRLYTEDSGGTVIEVGTNPTSLTTGTFTSTGIDDNATSTAITIDSSGDLLLGGTTSYTSFLSSSTGNLQVNGGIIGEPGSGNPFQIANYRSSPIAFLTSGNVERMRIDGSGNVGIKTTSPSFPLAGQLHISGGTGYVGLNLQKGSAGTGHLLEFTDENNTLQYRIGTNFSSGGQNLLFAYGSTPTIGMMLNSSGNVGIGNTGSNAKLEVTATSGEVFRADASGGAYRIVANQTGVNLNGNVGIGTSSPTNNLDVGFADLGSGSIGFRSTTYSQIAKIVGSHDSGTAEGSLRFHTRSGGSEPERMRIDSSGNVGIGTTSPDGSDWNSSSKLLHIFQNDANGGLLKLESSNTSGFLAAGNSQLQIGTIEAQPFKFYTSSTERMRIDSSGNLLVGTTSAGSASAEAVIGVGPSGYIMSKYATVAASGTADITINTGGGGYQGFLVVTNTVSANAGLRTHTTYSVFGRGTDSSIQSIATDDGSSGGASFTVTTPSNGVIRITNTTVHTCAVSIQFFGGLSA